MKMSVRADIELHLEKMSMILSNIYLSNQRIEDTEKWLSSDIGLYIYNRDKRIRNLEILINANKFWHRAYHRALLELNVKSTNVKLKNTYHEL